MANDNINFPNTCNICGKTDCIHTKVDPQWLESKYSHYPLPQESWKQEYLGYHPTPNTEYIPVSLELSEEYIMAKYKELIYKEKQLQYEKQLMYKEHEKKLMYNAHKAQFPFIDVHYDPSPAHLSDKSFLHFIEAPKRIPYDKLIKVIKT
jgi:hypothetical protein